MTGLTGLLPNSERKPDLFTLPCLVPFGDALGDKCPSRGGRSPACRALRGPESLIPGPLTEAPSVKPSCRAAGAPPPRDRVHVHLDLPGVSVSVRLGPNNTPRTGGPESGGKLCTRIWRPGGRHRGAHGVGSGAADGAFPLLGLPLRKLCACPLKGTGPFCQDSAPRPRHLPTAPARAPSPWGLGFNVRASASGFGCTAAPGGQETGQRPDG